MKRKFLSLIFVTLVSCAAFCKTVKVGYFIDNGSFMAGFSEEDPRYGYAYEYLLKVASCTGWNYEFVYGDWDDLYQALMEGKIDLLPDVTYMKSREQYFSYPDYAMGTENYYLYANIDNKEIFPDDLSTFNGKKIGVNVGTYQYELFKEWKKDSKLNFQIVEYPQKAEMREHFDDGDVDLYLSIDIISEFYWNPMVKIGQSDYYLVVSKKSEYLLKELNEALSQIYTAQPYFNSELNKKYFSDITTTKSLTKKEENWLNKRDRVINFGYINNDIPFANNNIGQIEGLLPDMLNALRNSFSIETVDVKFTPFLNYQKLQAALKEGKIDAAFPIFMDPYISETSGIVNSSRVYSVPMGYVCRKGADVFELKKVAVVKDSRAYNFIQHYFPGYEEVVFNSERECLSAVINHKADCAFMNLYKLQNYLNNDKQYAKLQMVTLPSSYDICFGVLPENYPLCTILNKLLATIPDVEKNISVEKNSVQYTKISVKKIVQEYFGLVVVILMFVALLIVALFVAIDRLLDYVNFDPLTHLLNRRRMDFYVRKFIKNSEEQNEKFCVAIFDIDGFKKINDTYGHDCGDKVLIRVSAIISSSIKECDYAFRWGGEEFLLLVKADKEITAKVCERIRSSIEASELYYSGDIVPITATAGFCEYENGMNYQQLFIKTDENLYHGKEIGKNCVVG